MNKDNVNKNTGIYTLNAFILLLQNRKKNEEEKSK